MYYTYQDFSKKDKQLIRSLVGVAAKKEVKSFLEKMLPVHQSIVEKEQEDIREPYWEFFYSFKDFSKHLQRRYDSYSHSSLPGLLTLARVEGHLTDVHFAEFSAAGKAKLDEMFVLEKKRWE